MWQNITRFFSQLNRFTRIVLIIAMVFIIYGYLCRMAGIRFFWESDSVGWSIFMVAVIGFLVSRIKRKRAEGKKVIGEKLIVGLLVFVLFLQVILVVVISNSNAYAAAQKQLKLDSALRAEVGNVSGFGLLPYGNIAVTSSVDKEFGTASISLIVKGDRKFTEMVVFMIKHPDSTEWKMEGFE